jgi:membrane protease YdiL (CAAX protease family)
MLRKASVFVNLSTGRKVHWPSVVWVSLGLLIFQLALGRGLADIRQARLSLPQLALGVPLAYLWLVVEVGVVEEFFFRALLQSRVAAFTKSEAAGVVVASLVFGLAHAPGLYFRTTATGEGLGPSPSWLMAVGYSVVVTSVPGLFLGILWSRTKSLASLVLIHAAGDLVPNLVELTRLWASR